MKLSVVCERPEPPGPYSSSWERLHHMLGATPIGGESRDLHETDEAGASEARRIVQRVLDARRAMASTQVAAAQAYVRRALDQMSPHAAARAVAAVEAIALEAL